MKFENVFNMELEQSVSLGRLAYSGRANRNELLMKAVVYHHSFSSNAPGKLEIRVLDVFLE